MFCRRVFDAESGKRCDVAFPFLFCDNSNTIFLRRSVNWKSNQRNIPDCNPVDCTFPVDNDGDKNSL